MQVIYECFEWVFLLIVLRYYARLAYLYRWYCASVLKKTLRFAKLVDIERYEVGRNPLPSMFIVDSKNIQNADTAKEKGYDAGKKLLE